MSEYLRVYSRISVRRVSFFLRYRIAETLPHNSTVFPLRQGVSSTKTKMTSYRDFHAILLCLLVALASSQSTLVVSVVSTTTIHATASDSNACKNFYGACVVYGDQGAPYTTTVYRDTTAAPTEVVTSSTTVVQTTTVSDAGACSNFAGSCVVYGGENGGAAYTTTVTGYEGGQADGQRPLGNSDGYIAQNKGGRPAVIGAGSTLTTGRCALISIVAVFMAAVWR